MPASPASGWRVLTRSIVCKNIALFLLIFFVTVVPLALRYYMDTRDYEIQTLASRLEVFAERGASMVDIAAIDSLTRPEQMKTPAHRRLVSDLNRIKKEFGVDNAIVMRRRPGGKFVYVAAGHGGFSIGAPVRIHSIFPGTYQGTNETWLRGEMMHSKLFGGRVGDREFDQFLQINAPLKRGERVVAILMLNKFANPVAASVRVKTLRVVGLTVVILVIGLGLFGFVSSRMLRPLQDLTKAASEVSQGNLSVTIPSPRSRDEVGRLSGAFGSMLEGLRQRDFIRDTFGRYISPEVVEEVLNSPDGLKLGGELREVTFLVSDLRGFTSMSARLGPQEVIEFINRYLEPMVEIISRRQGTVDEFQGDGILAFFGAPVSGGDDPERAVACALEMQAAMEEVNAEQRRRSLPELAMGIGINTGEVIVGNIGSEKRTKYGAMGAPINTAYRIESFTVGAQILISPTTFERVRGRVRVRDTQEVQFKGVDAPVTVYEITGLEGKYAISLPEAAPEDYVTLDVPIPVCCYPVEEKTVSEEAFPGKIIRLSAAAAEAEFEGRVEEHANVMMRFDPPAAGASTVEAHPEAGDSRGEAHLPEVGGLPEVYAKVRRLAPAEVASQGGGPTAPGQGAAPARVRLTFTSLPEKAKAFLEG
ncbi:MAG: adenylate/guanylate cyclase domain-containing protein, partial [bacterium]